MNSQASQATGPENRINPKSATAEARPIVARAVQKRVQSFGEALRARGRPNRVAQRHLLEAEEKIRPRLDAHRMLGNLGEAATIEQLSIGVWLESFHPALVCLPLVATFPLDVGLVVKATGKEAQEFPPTA